jgi:hypothetical protein
MLPAYVAGPRRGMDAVAAGADIRVAYGAGPISFRGRTSPPPVEGRS